MRREDVQAAFAGSYDDFLRDCRMELRIFPPEQREDVVRCWELVRRSNQLNLSGRRFALEEFADFVKDPGVLALAIHYRDRFGDYGIVGFSSLDLASNPPALVDFVLSCRVAQQRVEHGFLKWLSERLRERGVITLATTLVKTARNGPLRAVFSDLPFEVVDETEDRLRLRLDLSRDLGVRDLARIVAEPGAAASEG
jgi:FkbH-like protein